MQNANANIPANILTNNWNLNIQQVFEAAQNLYEKQNNKN